tara:strand:- start:546 stop:803 length:258 start_codon:yes stop_codon:yes gene_type:complete
MVIQRNRKCVHRFNAAEDCQDSPAFRQHHPLADDRTLTIYPLDLAWIVIGKNNVEAKLTKSNQAVTTAMQLIGIEVQFDYRQIPI